MQSSHADTKEADEPLGGIEDKTRAVAQVYSPRICFLFLIRSRSWKQSLNIFGDRC